MSSQPELNYERERRFLVSNPAIVNGWGWVLITQGYLWQNDGYTARVRLVQAEDSPGDFVDLDASFALKGPRVGDARFELEKNFTDFDTAREFIRRSPGVVRKKRYQVVDVETYDVDVFLDLNAGLIIAELEGGDEIVGVRRPEWCSEEITTKDRFNNEMLAFRPYNVGERGNA